MSIESVCNNLLEEIFNFFERIFNINLLSSQLSQFNILNKNIENWNFCNCDRKLVLSIIRKMKNSIRNIDNISILLLKQLQEKHYKILTKQFNKWLSGLLIDKSFKRKLLLPLPKISSFTLLKHFRLIVVLSTIYRVYSTIINN
ncbi:hypothetical protein ABK040_012979 [Willaertia magna]